MMLRLAATVACVAAATVVGVVFLGAEHTAAVLTVLAVISLVTLSGTEAVLRARRRGIAMSLSRQLSVAIALVIAPLLAALLVLGLLMFVSGKDAALVGVIVGVAGALGIAAAHRISSAVVDDVGVIRDGLRAVGEGERGLRLETMGEDELRELARAANAMIERLGAEEAARDQSDTARRHLIAAASHDLRTPITSLRLLAQAVDDRVVDGEERREYVRRMLTHVDVLSALIDDLFELSRLEAGDINWSLERVAVNELVSETVAAMRVHAEVKGVDVRAELPGDLDAARANPEKLQRVLFNLIQNAIRHTPTDGSVVVRAEALGGAIEVEVADSGDGIAGEERPHVFEAFYRGGADAARTTTGAGLGLAVARAIVEAHGGRIWLPATPRGTRVRFSLPIAV